MWTFLALAITGRSSFISFFDLELRSSSTLGCHNKIFFLSDGTEVLWICPQWTLTYQATGVTSLVWKVWHFLTCSLFLNSLALLGISQIFWHYLILEIIYVNSRKVKTVVIWFYKCYFMLREFMFHCYFFWMLCSRYMLYFFLW